MHSDRSLLRSSFTANAVFALMLLAPGAFAQDEGGNGSYTAVAESQRPDFTFNTIDNEPRSADHWDGQVVLLDFWATWCAPCVREMPIFNDLRAKYHEQGFEVVGLAADERDRVAAFLERVPVDFPILFGNVFEVMDLSLAYGNAAQVLPFSVLIDRAGNVRYLQKPGGINREDLEKLIRSLL